MKIADVPIDQIKPAAYNPRKDLKPGDPEYDRLKKAIKEFDLVEPLVWNERTGNLVGGHQRLKILKDRGDTLATVSIVNMDVRQEKALNLALNKHAGEWDFAALAEVLRELRDLNTGDMDLDITGFSEAEIERAVNWLPANGGLTDEDAVPELPATPT